MRLRRLAPLLVVMAAPLSAASPDGAWSAALGVSVGAPSGYVRVREFDIEGTRLRLRGDLGVTSSKTLALAVGRRVGASGELSLAIESVFLYGSSRPAEDVLFNGSTIQGGEELRTRPEFFRASLFYGRTLLGLAGGGVVSGRVGLTFVFLNFKLEGTLAPSTRLTETKEDFVTQELPVPIVGLGIDVPLSGRLRLVGSIDGGYLPRVDSLRSEGGDVKLTQSHADLGVGVRWALAPRLDVTAGYRLTVFVQHEISREDDNDIHLTDHALAVSLAHRF